MDKVRFIGVSELEEEEQVDVRGEVGEFLRKFKKLMPDFEELVLHVKQYGVEGRPKFSAHARFIAPRVSKDASADDYILTKAVHYALNAVEKQLKNMH